MQAKFEWTPGIGAAPLYPMEMYRCNYIYADGNGVSPAPPNLTYGVWGEENGTSLVGDLEKPIPVSLQISWLSYTENKFYGGHFKLPYDKMLKLFQHGYQMLVKDDDGTKHLIKDNYNAITAGLAPGGVVVVWLIGADFTTEVGRFQAEETKIDMKDFAPDAWTHDQNKYVKGMIGYEKAAVDNLEKNGIPFGLWDRYRERFNQRPIVKFDQTKNVALDNMEIKYYNGEKEIINSEKWQKNEFKERARVKKMGIGWNGMLGNKPQYYILDINFDEAEMFRGYKEAYGDNPEQEGQLVVEINRGGDRYKVYLQVGDRKIELIKKQGEIELYNIK
ncbi:DUF2931 family protein [Pedobacter sp. UYP30]|uniref:DUF2931 family protein n=1 Tax=Pedobacter sp. UYP30 TaxID=1756400 RepID=UPI003394FBDD